MKDSENFTYRFAKIPGAGKLAFMAFNDSEQ